MSATLVQSIAWDAMTEEQKRAAAALLVAGQYYQVRGPWGTAVVRCLNPDTKQFRIISATFKTYEDTVPLFGDGWVVTLSPTILATTKPCPAPL